MRIALIDTGAQPHRPGRGGLGDVIWSMAEQLHQLGDEVHVFGPYTSREYPSDDVQVHAFSPPWPGWRTLSGRLRIPIRAWRLLQKEGYFDIIHAAEYTTTGILPLFRPKSPLILTVPGNIFEHVQHGNPYNFETTVAYKALARVSARFCAHIVATCTDMAMWWAYTGANPCKISVIPYGVDTSIFHPQEGARGRLGIPSDEKMVLFIGRLERETKGLDYLIRAFELLSPKYDVVLRLIGEGKDEDALRHMVAESGMEHCVKFHKWVDLQDVPLWYSAASVCVAPSISEGYLRVFAEAMACACPFIGTPIAGMKDHIVSGVNGLLVKQRDAIGLAEAIAQVLGSADFARDIAIAGHNYARNSLDWKVITRRIREEIYQPVRDEWIDSGRR